MSALRSFGVPGFNSVSIKSWRVKFLAFHLRYRALVLLVFSFCFFSQMQAFADTGDGGYAGSFLLLGLEGKAVGMGGAFVGVADNVGGALWNPAGTAQLENRTFGASYRKMFFDRGMGWIGYAQPVRGESAIGLSWINAGVADVVGRDLEGNPTEEINNYQNAVIFNFARKIHEKISLGLNIKYIQYNLANISAYGVGFDFGAMGSPIPDLRIGACIQNVGMKYSWNSGDYWSEHGEQGTDVKDNFPIDFKFGASYLLFEKDLLLALEVDKNEKQDARFYLGAEYNVIKRFSLRAGYNDELFSFGAGLRHEFEKFTLNFDYAFVSSKVEEDPDHLFSIGVGF